MLHVRATHIYRSTPTCPFGMLAPLPTCDFRADNVRVYSKVREKRPIKASTGAGGVVCVLYTTMSGCSARCCFSCLRGCTWTRSRVAGAARMSAHRGSGCPSSREVWLGKALSRRPCVRTDCHRCARTACLLKRCPCCPQCFLTAIVHGCLAIPRSKT